MCYLAEIYAAREKRNTIGISSADIARELPNGIFFADNAELEKRCARNGQPGDIIPYRRRPGDYYKIGRRLVAEERIRYDARRNEAARPQPDRLQIRRVRIPAALVTLALLAFIWIVNYLAQKIGGQPILIDLNAVQKLDYQNMIRIDFANAEFVPTAILILFQLVDIVLSYGYIAYQLRVVRGEASGFGNLLDGFTITGRAIALTLLIDALVMVASAALPLSPASSCRMPMPWRRICRSIIPTGRRYAACGRAVS